MKIVNLERKAGSQNKGIDEINFHSIVHEQEKWVPLCKRKKISILWIFAICANQISMSFIWIPLGVLLNPYCQKLNLSNFGTTLVFLIGCGSGFIFPPIIAALSDSTTFKYGRRRIFMVFGETFVMIGLLMISFCRELSSKFNTDLNQIQSANTNSGTNSTLNYNNNAAIFYFVTGIILTYFGGNVANGPGRAMCSDVVPASQQVLVSSICVLDNAIAGVISNSIGALKLYKYTSLNNETLVLVCSSIIGLITLIISVVSTPEERLINKPKKRNPLVLILESFRTMKKSLFYVLMAFFFQCIGAIQFALQSSNYIAKNIFGGVPNAPDGLYDAGISHAQFLALFQTIVQVCYSSINTKVVDLIGFKNTWNFAMICLFFADILFYLISNKYLLSIPYFLNGICVVVANSIPYAYVSLITPAEKLAGNISLVILFGNFGSVLAILGLSMFLGSFKYFEENTGRLIFLSSVFVVIAIIFGEFGYKNVSTKGTRDEFDIVFQDNENDNDNEN